MKELRKKVDDLDDKYEQQIKEVREKRHTLNNRVHNINLIVKENGIEIERTDEKVDRLEKRTGRLENAALKTFIYILVSLLSFVVFIFNEHFKWVP